MKTSVFSLVFIFYFVSFLHAQYEPLATTDKYWIYSFYDSPEGPLPFSGFLIRIAGDTTIASIAYKKIVRHELHGSHPCPPSHRPCFEFTNPYSMYAEQLIGFVREDISTKQVFYRPLITTYCGEAEALIYDFDKSVGEALNDCAIQVVGGMPNFGNVDSTSTDLFEGKMRNTLHTTGYMNSIGLLHEGPLRVLEGFGLERYGILKFDLSELSDFCEGSLEECEIFSSTVNRSSFNPIFQFRPNPFSSEIFVTAPSGLLIKKIALYMMNGKKILELREHNKIDTRTLSPGIYYAEALDNIGNYHVGKVIKID